MTICSWIVCERGGRWTPAFRLALARDTPAHRVRHRLREVRRLAELAANLADRPLSIAAIEIHRGNFAEALAWLAAAEFRFPAARSVALVDRGIATESVLAALREAGALEIAISPRQMRPLVELGVRHAAEMGGLATLASESDPLTLTARAWASLPWQDA